MEKIIEEKMRRQQNEEEHQDAFDYMLSTSKEQGQKVSIQELKVQPGRTHTHTGWISRAPASLCHCRKQP